MEKMGNGESSNERTILDKAQLASSLCTGHQQGDVWCLLVAKTYRTGKADPSPGGLQSGQENDHPVP